MKNKVLLSRLCICTLTVSLLAGCSSAGSTSETANNRETESISSETASETVSENESATTSNILNCSSHKTSPSTDTVSTCHGINLPLFFIAVTAAF